MQSLTKKNINIIFYSSEIDKYKGFKEFIRANGIKAYSPHHVEAADDSIKSYIRQYGSDILNNCKKEYTFANQVRHKEQDYKCELCGHTGLSALYLIKNKITGKEFWVGSSCIQEFGLDKVKSYTNIALEMAFSQEIPDYDELITIPDTTIVIPSPLYSELEKRITELEKAKKSFVNEKSHISESIKRREKVLETRNKIDEYLKDNTDNKWAVKTEVIEWYKRLSDTNTDKTTASVVMDRLLYTGIYEKSNVSEVLEPNHKAHLIQLFTNQYRDTRYKFSTDQSGYLFMSTVINKKSIVFKVDELKLFRNYQNELMIGESIQIDDIKQYVNISVTIDNIYNFLESCTDNHLAESFSITNDFLLIDVPNERKLLKVEPLSQALDILKLNNNITDLAKNVSKVPNARHYKKSYINKNVNEVPSLKTRHVFTPVEGIHYEANELFNQ